MTMTTQSTDYESGMTGWLADGDKADDQFQAWDFTTWYVVLPVDGGWVIHGGDGNDTLGGASGMDDIYGDDGHDVLHGGDDDDALYGGLGRDKLYGDDGDDMLYASTGSVDQDSGYYSHVAGDIEGDLLDGGEGNDILHGSVRNDTLLGGAGDDSLHGGDGDDWLDGGSGLNELHGGDGNDTYVIHNAYSEEILEKVDEGHDTVVLLGGNCTLQGNVEDIRVDASVQLGTGLFGNALNNHMIGGAGGDTLNGGDGHDWLDGMGGIDNMAGGLGNDTYVVEQAGDKVVEAVDAGIDTVYVMLADYTVGANIENIQIDYAGSASATGNGLGNEMTGNESANTMSGLAGNDLINGRGGEDWLYGGDGTDTINGGLGMDRIYGDAGNDSLNGELGMDLLWGGTGSDTLKGGSDLDILHGDDGTDQLYGELGNDYLYGDAGLDKLFGGDGNDALIGGTQRDELTGGAGSDTFRYLSLSDSQGSARDLILDFTQGMDRIDLSSIDADTTLSGNQAFHFMGAKPFFASAGDLWAVVQRDGTTAIFGDANGDGVEDLRIDLIGNHSLSAADFVA